MPLWRGVPKSVAASTEKLGAWQAVGFRLANPPPCAMGMGACGFP